MRNYSYILLFGTLALLSLCCNTNEVEHKIVPTTWEEILAQAQGQEVDIMMWMGDPQINRYMRSYIIPRVKDSFGIKLNLAPAEGAQAFQLLLNEINSGVEYGEVDLCWINGETFFKLRNLGALWGPWTDRVPNSKYIDYANPFIGLDFQEPIEGYELPWGNVQMTLIYDRKKVATPPKNRAELLSFVQENPGRFTWDTKFTGLTFLKALLIDVAGSGEELAGDFDESKYKKYSSELWQYLEQLRPHLWRRGETFPEGVAQMHQMFANGELWFTMSNNDSEVDNKQQQGVFPASARAYVPDFGTIQNSHYIGISDKSANKAACMVVANFLASPNAQLHKADPVVWGDGTVLDISRLDSTYQKLFRRLPSRINAPSREEIIKKAHMELAPEYMIRLQEDFRKNMIHS